MLLRSAIAAIALLAAPCVVQAQQTEAYSTMSTVAFRL